jgi:serine/threonine-protein kinase
MEDAEATPVPGTEASNPYGVVFAPDGNWLAFFSIATGRIVRVPVSGGAHLTVAEVGNRRSIWGLRWNRDNTLCYVDADGIKRVPAAGGPPQLVVATSQGESADAPQLLADGQSLLFAVTDKAGPARWDEASIVIQSIESGRRQVIWEGGSSPVYLPSGHLIFARGAALFAVPFDIERRITTGEPSEVISGVARGGPAFGGPAQISLSDTGTLSYVTGESGRAAPRRFVRVNRAGQAQSVALPSDRYLDPRVSPDGSRVAVAIEKSGNADIWVLDLDGGNRMRLTEPPGTNRYPLWTLDGADVLFALSRAAEYGLYRKPASGHGRAEPLIVDTRRSSWPWSWVPGGRAVALSDFSLIGDTGYDISLLTLEGERVRTPLLSEHVAEAQPGISPNGRWLAYRSDDSGR